MTVFEGRGCLGTPWEGFIGSTYIDVPTSTVSSIHLVEGGESERAKLDVSVCVCVDGWMCTHKSSCVHSRSHG